MFSQLISKHGNNDPYEQIQNCVDNEISVEDKEFKDIFLFPSDINSNPVVNSDYYEGNEKRKNEKYKEFFDTIDIFSESYMSRRDGRYWSRNRYDYYHFLSHDILIYTKLSNERKNCPVLHTELHERAIRAIFEKTELKPEETLKSLPEISYFDFASLNWEQILRLRKDSFIRAFRKKITSWKNEYCKYNNLDNWQKDLNRMIEDAKWEMIGKSIPNPRGAILKGLIGLLPIPYLNPVDLCFTVSDIADDFNKTEKYGWIYFISKAVQMSKQPES